MKTPVPMFLLSYFIFSMFGFLEGLLGTDHEFYMHVRFIDLLLLMAFTIHFFDYRKRIKETNIT